MPEAKPDLGRLSRILLQLAKEIYSVDLQINAMESVLLISIAATYSKAIQAPMKSVGADIVAQVSGDIPKALEGLVSPHPNALLPAASVAKITTLPMGRSLLIGGADYLISGIVDAATGGKVRRPASDTRSSEKQDFDGGAGLIFGTGQLT